MENCRKNCRQPSGEEPSADVYLLQLVGIMLLTRVQGVREFLDEIGHPDGDDDDWETDELDGQLERALLGTDLGPVQVQDSEHEQGLDGQQTGEGGGRHELFHGEDSRCTKASCARNDENNPWETATRE